MLETIVTAQCATSHTLTGALALRGGVICWAVPGRDGEAEASFSSGDAESFELGHRLVRKGDLAGAEEAYQRADEAGQPAAAACVGVFAEARGDLRGAEEAYRRADERGSGFGSFRLGL